MDSRYVKSLGDKFARRESEEPAFFVVIHNPLALHPVHAAIDVQAGESGFGEVVGDVAGVLYRRGKSDEG